MFFLQFDTDNDVFAEGTHEVRGILADVAEAVRRGISDGIVRDSNGNSIGHWSLKNTARTAE